MTIFAGLDDIPIMRGQVTIPAYGIWHADLWLDREVALSGQVRLALADISALATVVRVIGFLGQTGVRIVGGYGGWRTSVPGLQYAAATGLSLRTVLAHTAADVGELVDAADTAIGTAYVRAVGPASRVLQSLIPGAWYVGFDGVTYAAPRPAGVVANRYMTMDVSQPAGASIHRCALASTPSGRRPKLVSTRKYSSVLPVAHAGSNKSFIHPVEPYRPAYAITSAQRANPAAVDGRSSSSPSTCPGANTSASDCHAISRS